MTDPARDALREWLNDPLRDYLDERDRAYLAALATTPAPLDVERLTRALHRVQSVADGHGDPTAPPDESCRIDAEAIAREYASAPPSKETPNP